MSTDAEAEANGALCLAWLLDAPMQSWASASRFQRRGTNHHPTKSGVAGLLAAALGLPKGSERERDMLAGIAALRMTTILLPRVRGAVKRLRDYHTVGGGFDKKTHPLHIPRKAKGGPGDNAVVTEREYLTDARFGVVLRGEVDARSLLEELRGALANPVWGVWFGRKCCLPAAPLGAELHATEDAALRALMERVGWAGRAPEEFEREREISDIADADAIFEDQPIAFGTGRSSGFEGREYRLRGVRLHRAVREQG